MGFKRRREPHNVDVKLVELYEDLASEKDEIRLKAASGLVSQFTPDQDPADEKIKKVLARLFRGLCSSRKAARIGFSIALTEILTQVFTVPRETERFSFADALKLWEAQSNSSGSESGQVGGPDALVIDRMALIEPLSAHRNNAIIFSVGYLVPKPLSSLPSFSSPPSPSSTGHKSSTSFSISHRRNHGSARSVAGSYTSACMT